MCTPPVIVFSLHVNCRTGRLEFCVWMSRNITQFPPFGRQDCSIEPLFTNQTDSAPKLPVATPTPDVMNEIEVTGLNPTKFSVIPPGAPVEMRLFLNRYEKPPV